jgi:hypothetical protein
MEIRYSLAMADHLAWYDHYLAMPEGECLRSSFPFVGRFRRWRFSRQVISPPSCHALGERTLEVTDKGVREFSPEFSFTTAWADIGLVVVTSSRLFLAHKSMNAHIVPLRFFESDAKRDSFIVFARDHTMLPNTALEPTPTAP